MLVSIRAILGENLMLLVVHILVTAETLKIIISLLHHSDKQDKHEGSEVGDQEA